jgi:glycosyltransferase involved in cell wall biosynthesis
MTVMAGKVKNVLCLAENAISPIQGGGIVVYAVLQGLPPENVFGFYDYRNITPATEYADRFLWLGPWHHTPFFKDIVNSYRGVLSDAQMSKLWPMYLFHNKNDLLKKDLAFIRKTLAQQDFKPELIYFSGLSLRYLQLSVMLAEKWDLPMVVLHMDNWMAVEKQHLGGEYGKLWHREIVKYMKRAALRSLSSTTNSPKLARVVTEMTGYEHVPANNCCSDMMKFADPASDAENEIPVITYAGAMNRHLQGETLEVMAGAISELNAEGTKVRLDIYAPWEFAPYANSLQIPNAVCYKGQVSRSDLANVYLKSDFLITTVTFRNEHILLFEHSLSTKLSEYLSVGKPVIGAGHPNWHLHEYLEENGCGFSIPIDKDYKRSEIKAAIRNILASSKEKRAYIGKTNRELWEKAHNVEVIARQTRKAIGLE